MPNTWSSAGQRRELQARDLAAKSNLMADGGQELAFREKIRGNDATATHELRLTKRRDVRALTK
jgi:hypothetical protein